MGRMIEIPEYQVWLQMRARCRNNNHPQWHRYGGRGISVCERWHDYENFIGDMGSRPTSDHMLDRIDNDGDYTPENCRWTTPDISVRNRERTRWVTIDGRTQCITDWARERGLHPRTVITRIDRGWGEREAIMTPAGPRRRDITYRGRTQSMADWAREVGLKPVTLRARLRRGWSVEQAIETPLGEQPQQSVA